MTNDKSLKSLKEIILLAEFAAEQIELEDELAREKKLVAAGSSGKAIALNLRSVLLGAELEARKSRLSEAKKKSQETVFEKKEGTLRFSKSPEDLRRLYEKLRAKLPEISPNFALQFRDYEEMGSEEIADLLDQALDLGLLSPDDERRANF